MPFPTTGCSSASTTSPTCWPAPSKAPRPRPARRPCAICWPISRCAARWRSPSTASDPPTGSFAVSNADRGLADEAPGDALYYAEGGNVGASLGGLIGSLKESVDSIPGAAEQLEMVESAMGGDLEEMVDWMGDAATVAGYDGEQAWGGAIIVPTSMEDARRTM